MITTTKGRLAEHGPLDNDAAWSYYGTPVRLTVVADPHQGMPES